jgi:hypothetical protein
MANFYGTDHQAHVVDVDSNSVRIDIVHPSFTLEKLALDADGQEITDGVMVGDWVYYKIIITNTGDVWLNLSIVDELLGYTDASPYIPAQPLKKAGDGINVLVLTGALWDYQTQHKDIPTLTNTVEVTGKDHQLHEVTHEDDVTINVYDYASMFGWVFRDDNLDGTFQMFVEPGLPGDITDGSWLIEVYGNDIFGNPQYYPANSEEISGYYGDDLISIMPSDANGYTVKVTWTNPKWAPTTPIIILNVVVGSGESKGPYNFGFVEQQEITGYKWRDDNMNGVKDDDEPFLNGWVIILEGYKSFGPVNERYVYIENTTGPTPEHPNQADGYFSFIVWPGHYTVREKENSLGGSWYCTMPGASLGYDDVTILSPGEQVWCCKFGNVKLGEINGIKFLDLNMNRVRDNGEAYLDGWTIYLDGVLVNGTVVHKQTVTSNGGKWSFTGLLPGTYKVSEEDRYGWHATTPMYYERIDIRGSGTVVSSVKFGNVPTTTIWGYKFLDKDLDKQNDIGKEPGLAGWTIKLEKLVGSDWILVYSTTTDANGKYLFRDVFQQPGQYRVVEVLQTGWINTTRVIPFSVEGRPVEPTVVRIDIGNIRTSSVEGFKFEDQYGPNGELPNMVKDAGEWGIGNWHITLEGRMVNGTYVFMEAWTRNDGCLLNEVGFYGFTMLLPGTYWLNESVVEQGWVPTTPSSLRITVPAYSVGPPFKMVINFGNTHPEDPELNFVLRKGTNLWSSPLQMGVSLKASELASIVGPNCLSIKTYNNGKYYTYKPGVSGPAEDFEISYGVGYYIVVKGFTTFRLSGNLVSGSQTTLVKGTNIIGFDELKPIMASQFVNQDPTAGPVYVHGATVLLIKYLGSDGKYYTYKPGVSGPAQDFILTQGRAYFLVLDSPGTIVYPTGG